MKDETVKKISTALTIGGLVLSGIGAFIGDRVQRIMIKEEVQKELTNLLKKKGT